MGYTEYELIVVWDILLLTTHTRTAFNFMYDAVYYVMTASNYPDTRV